MYTNPTIIFVVWSIYPALCILSHTPSPPPSFSRNLASQVGRITAKAGEILDHFVTENYWAMRCCPWDCECVATDCGYVQVCGGKAMRWKACV